MILYSLRCSGEHVFEAWFKDGASYDEQAEAGGIVCPICASSEVEKAPMAPRINSGAIRRTEAEAGARAMRQMLVQLRDQVEQNCEYVGSEFAEEALKVHYGEADPRDIYGEATEDEVEQLAEEGIEFGRIPWLPRTNS